MSTRAVLNKRLRFAAKLLFVAALLYLLVRNNLISFKDTGRAMTQWPEMGRALAGMTIATLLGIVRWQLLLRAQGIHLSHRRATVLTLIGSFFSIALPGAVSGDFVKAFYVGREVGGQKARAFGSILFDRVAGLSALVLVSACALLLGIQSFWGSPLMAAIRVFMIVAGVCVVAFYAYLFLVREKHDPVLWLLRRGEARVPRLGAITRIYLALRHYHHHRIAVLQILVISVAIHLLVGWAVQNIAQAFGESVPLIATYVVVPLGMLVTAIPITPAGVGTGNAAFAYLFHLIGATRGGDFFTLYAVYQIVLGAIGGLVYLQFRTHEPKPEAIPGEPGELEAAASS